MKKIYYEKVGQKYVPVAEYDSDYMDSFTKGNHLVMCYPGGTSRRFNIDPAFAPLIAAGRYAEDVIAKALIQASDLRPSKATLTIEQKVAWETLAKAFGEDKHNLTWPAARDAVEAAIQTLQTEADMLLSNTAVRKAYDNFMLMCQLSKEEK